MHHNRLTYLRWMTSVALAAIAIYCLFAAAVGIGRTRSYGWMAMTFVGVVGVVLAAVFAFAAVCFLKRRYSDLMMLVGLVAGLALLFLCETISGPFHDAYVTREFSRASTPTDHDEWRTLAELALSASLLFGPFILVGWFIRTWSRFAARRFSNAIS